MQENASVDNDKITFTGHIELNNNVRFAGEDIAKNSVVFKAGRKLKAVDVGLLASIGINQVSVYETLKVAVFSTLIALSMLLIAVSTGNKPGALHTSFIYIVFYNVSDF